MHHFDDPLYDNIAAFTAGLVANGITDVVISPGSRSTPLSVTLHAHPSLRTWIQIDERSAGFFALGMARATGRPSVLVCTSGTAAANYLPAVVEAHHAGVPMIVCTADRPPELQSWGAGQTIDQHDIFGSATRWSADLPVASEWSPTMAERTAMRAVAVSTGSRPGPVHLNWPFRLPLEPRVAPSVRDPGFTPRVHESTASRPTREMAALLCEVAGLERGVIVVGPSDGVGLPGEHEVAEAISEFAVAVGWPIIAEPLTQLRRTDAPQSNVMANAGSLLADETFAGLHVPEVVLRVGRAPTTKSVRLWMQHHRPSRVVLIDPSEHWHEPSFTITDRLVVNAASILTLQPASGDAQADPSGWLTSWRRADRLASDVIEADLVDAPLMAALVARTLVEALPAGSTLFTSNSMPVRDLDSFVGVGGPRISVVGNRGASGIDGIVSTTLGIAAATDHPVAMLIGDLALLHDLSGMISARRLGLHLTAVCVDNDGGEIFSMLPIADHGADIDFAGLFRTPHGIDIAGLAGFAGIAVSEIGSVGELCARLQFSFASKRPGVDLLVVRIDPDNDMDQHRRISAAVSAALGL